MDSVSLSKDFLRNFALACRATLGTTVGLPIISNSSLSSWSYGSFESIRHSFYFFFSGSTRTMRFIASSKLISSFNGYSRLAFGLCVCFFDFIIMEDYEFI